MGGVKALIHNNNHRGEQQPELQHRRRGSSSAATAASEKRHDSQCSNEAVGDLAAAEDSAAAAAAAAGPKVPPVLDVFAGGIARAASQSTIHPMDTVKVRMQALTKQAVRTPAAAAATATSATCQRGTTTVALSPRLVFARAVSALVSIRGEVASLYKGVAGAAGGAGLAIGAYFAFYGATTELLEKHGPEIPLGVKAFLAGAAGAIGASFIKVPASVCIRGVQAGLHNNIFACAVNTVKTSGVQGLFVGYFPTLIEDVPDMAVKFAAYESLRQLYVRLTGRQRDESSTVHNLVMGGIAGAVAAAATTPLDVMKTRMMVSAGTSKPVGAIAACKQVVSANGKRGLFAGWWPRTSSNFINSGIFFVFFEGLRTALWTQSEKLKARRCTNENM